MFKVGQTEEEKKEKELMDTIKKGNFEEIEKKITPREFQNCQSNSLRMGMKVCTVVHITSKLDDVN